MTYRMIMNMALFVALAVAITGCSKDDKKEESQSKPATEEKSEHKHEDGSTHEDHGDDDHGDHEHDEVSLGKAKVGDHEVEFAQGHGKVEAGKESHLVVKLPYNDKGKTVVRAWIGTKDRLKSVVGKGEYAPSHDDYDIHAMAPDPLPENVMWWVEIEKPDGTKLVGSVKPLLE